MRKTIKRKTVAGAFRRMGHGVEDKAAHASTVAYYRSAGKVTLR